MSKNNKKQYAGIWLDNEKAMIITNEDGEDYAIGKKVKAKENHSGGSEHTMNNAKQADNLKYYKSLATELMDYDEILIFGPGQSQEQLHNHLQGDSQFNNKQITIDTADQLTENQIVARVREQFKSKQ